MKKSANKLFVFDAVKNTAAIAVKAMLVFLFFFLSVITVHAQQPAANNDLSARLTERSKKIVNNLLLTDSGVYNYTVTALTSQYFNLNQVHDKFKYAAEDIKAKNPVKEEADKMIAEASVQKNTALQNLHKSFMQTLAAKLTEDKIEVIKNGMTYNVAPITYAAYQKMILSLTDIQKLKIYNWLLEARELAMDEGSSDDKHKMFGKYKGKINNYLSAEGYDVKKEGEEWAKREAEEKKARQLQN
jgi:Protein of unknown function (DUF3826)